MASQFLPLNQIPDGATPVIKWASSAGTQYTPAAGRVFHMVYCWLQVAGSSTVGSLTLQAQAIYDSSAQNLFVVRHGGAGAAEIRLGTLWLGDFPVKPNTNISAVATTLTAATIDIGFYGWEEAQSR